MPRAPKQCGHIDCAERVRGGIAYCPEHERAYQKRMASRRGSTAGRGYGARHQRLRAKWATKVAAGGVRCWRCGEPIDPSEPWDLGHDDKDRSITRGPEHANRCNRASANRKGPPPPPPVDLD